MRTKGKRGRGSFSVGLTGFCVGFFWQLTEWDRKDGDSGCKAVQIRSYEILCTRTTDQSRGEGGYCIPIGILFIVWIHFVVTLGCRTYEAFWNKIISDQQTWTSVQGTLNGLKLARPKKEL